ncbi:MAG: DUF3817 domain-containing protein [Myxococcota bacterium]
MTGWVLWRFVKFVSVALLASGVFGSIFGATPATRRRAGQRIATVGLFGVWLAGYALAKKTGVSIGEPWISRSLLAGLLALAGACMAGASDRVPPWAAALGLGGLLSGFGWMSSRTLEQAWMLGAAVPAVVAAGTVLWIARRNDPVEADPERDDATFQWFTWLARAEGVSLLMLFGVYMPLKYGAGIVLDNGQGWFGWVHGVLQLAYIVSLLVTARVLGWGLLRTTLGFVASLVPLGTFIFERRARSS